jgi:hypothetical protein
MTTVEKKSTPVWVSILVFVAIMAAVMVVGMLM